MQSKTLALFLLLFWPSLSCSADFTKQYHAYRFLFKPEKGLFVQADEQELKTDMVVGLLNKENEGKDLQLQQEKTTRWMLIAFASLLLIAIALVYLDLRNKQKVNLLLDKRNRQLDILNEQLTAANQTKAKLFGIVSHDLRSPVSQLFTFIRLQQTNPGLLTESGKNEYQQELLLSSSNLLATMEDLLLWSKSQMDQFTLDNEDIDVACLLTELMGPLQAEVKDKKLKIEIEKPDYQFVISDYNLLSTILRNLLQNAVTHAFPETVISVCANINEQQQPYISIINHGEMIPAERIRQLINDVDINSKPSGYGLLIVKDLSAVIGAQLNICSTLEGTTSQVIFS